MVHPVEEDITVTCSSRQEIIIKEFVQNNFENKLSSNLIKPLSPADEDRRQSEKGRIQLKSQKSIDSKNNENLIHFIDNTKAILNFFSPRKISNCYKC